MPNVVIAPKECTVDREMEHEWVQHINSELLKEWGPHEIYRTVEIRNEQSQLARWIADLYRDAGWWVSTNSDMKNPAKYTTFKFGRPGTPTENRGVAHA